MRRILFLALCLLLCLCSCDFITESTSESASSESESESTNDGKITIEYRALDGGYIEGTALQSIVVGEKGTAVRAIANEGYRFIGWDDGFNASARLDSPSESVVICARFEKLFEVTFSCNKNHGYIDGQKEQAVGSGQKTTYVTAVPKTGYRFVCWDSGETSDKIQISPTEDIELVAIFSRVDLCLPVLAIDTLDGSNRIPKGDYRDCTINVENTEKYNFKGESGGIRGRGNTSYQLDKRSYKIKFDNAIDLFGNGKAKEWTLISNHFDLSLSRNYLAYSVAYAIGLEYSSSVQFVDLYLNGEYRGVYLVCDQIEIGENRVNITDSDALDTGYVIELDEREDNTNFVIDRIPYSIKEPNTLRADQIAFVEQYMNDCMSAIKGSDYSQIEALIDTESFARAYIVFEMFKCVDVGFSSFYMYKDAGDKLFCGPVWDFDRSVGNISNNESARRYYYLWAKMDNVWFNYLLRHDEFKELVGSLLDECTPIIEQTLSDCYTYLEENRVGFDRNFERWQILGTYVYPNPSELNNLRSWQEQLNFVKDYLKNSLAFLKNSYPAPTVESE